MSFKAAVVYQDIVTAYGAGPQALWQGVLPGKSAIAALTRFNTQKMQSPRRLCAGLVQAAVLW